MSRYNLNKTVFLSQELVDDMLENTNSLRSLIMGVGKDYRVYYGYDHVFEYFLQLEPVEITDEEEVIDIDSFYNGMSGNALGYFLMKCGAPHDHVENCFLDLPF